jgi:phospholipid-transporting ATPase
LKRVLVFLSACHTIIIDQRKGTYNSASPDELALVNAAKQFGYIFKERDAEDNIIIEEVSSGKLLKYQLLNTCEFTSTRKRMSCIFRDPSGQIVLMCKGADAIIANLLSQDSLTSRVYQTTQQYVNEYALEGLRTLFLAEKIIDERFYAQWAEESK